MSTEKKTPRPGYFTILKCKCPRCRTGDMFVERNPYKLGSFMKMPDECPACGQEFEIEVGFYYGAHYVSYALAVALSVSTFVAWWVLIGFSLQDHRFFWWMGVNALVLIGTQPYLQRLSRAVWLSFFVRYEPQWRVKPPEKGERVNAGMAHVW